MKYYYRGLMFELTKDVYEPAEDSELLAETMEQGLRPGMTVLDIGCGCGLLGIIAGRAGCNVKAADINPEAVRLSAHNAVLNKVKMDCFVSNLFEKIDERFDLIVFNPPYLPDDDKVASSEMWSCLDTIDRFVSQVAAHLMPGGSILLLSSSLTPTSEVTTAFERAGFRTEIPAERKVPWENLSVIRAKR